MSLELEVVLRVIEGSTLSCMRSVIEALPLFECRDWQPLLEPDPLIKLEWIPSRDIGWDGEVYKCDRTVSESAP
jgi:hypothetical protein